MQNKGAIRLVAILLGLACLYQLSFTVVTRIEESKAKEYAAVAVEQFRQTPEYAAIDDNDKEFTVANLNREREKYYLDSISSEKIFFLYTFKECKEKEINLGLDLRGGMNVMLEVSVMDIVKSMANQNASPYLQEALSIATRNYNAAGGDFVALLGEAWNQVAPGRSLADEFSYELQYVRKETKQLTNAEVLAILRSDAESAIANSFNVLRNRIDHFGVAQPNIQRLANSGRILVELPGVKEPERVRKLLQGTASLEFWTTYENGEIYQALVDANRLIKEMQLAERPAETDTAAAAAVADTSSLSSLAQQSDSLAAVQNVEKEYPLFSILSPSVDPQSNTLMTGACIGHAHYRDTAKINAWLRLPQIQALFPREFVPTWTVKAEKRYNNAGKEEDRFELVAIKNTSDGKAPLDGGVVTDARLTYGQTGSPEVDMSMNAEGARIWARLTADASRDGKKCIAIVLDGAVYSYPRVQNEITGGRSSITGNFTISEATDLANVLKSGKLPAPAHIVQEAVVGPSLGEESINAGLLSFLIAFLLVLGYMLFFYNGAGVVANVALITNVFFLFGTLVSFGAVLTLPGIAGIVLTLGMAVDANVLIYERIKEELRGGKSLRLAVTDGYKNAYSAIVDGNLTTIITGIVLFAFGSGPIQGFATTLVIGIVTSLFTSIFITRLLFEGRLNRGKNITFNNKLTRDFLARTKVDFVKLRKPAYVLSVAIVVIGLSFIFTKGFTYGVDFTGGRTYVVRFDKPASTNDVRTAILAEMSGGATEVKQFGAESQIKITTTFMIEDNSEAVDTLVAKKLYNALKPFFAADIPLDEFTSTLENPNGIISSDFVGPTIASDIKRDAVIAVAIALIAIFLYIAARFRNWVWGTGGVLGLVFCTIFTISFFSIFSGLLPFSLDVDQTFIAAVLTIIGYAINDAVVIFDRIREYRTLYPKRELQQNVNEALNSTLSRTVNTTGSTLVVLISIAIFGGEVIRGFSVALIVGIIASIYATLFVGTPVVYDLYGRKQKKEIEKK
ncbi:MAG: protein translocase subunit SecDF [Prevotellaceae bacterium]|jgi:SecD/SecF fusion protein|nr:protein translocase subunit SecDF [Prevotellaceae bacterium]